MENIRPAIYMCTFVVARRRIYINRFVISEKKGKDIPSSVKAALATILTKKIICFGNW
jgi:hypothetical protein